MALRYNYLLGQYINEPDNPQKGVNPDLYINERQNPYQKGTIDWAFDGDEFKKIGALEQQPNKPLLQSMEQFNGGKHKFLLSSDGKNEVISPYETIDGKPETNNLMSGENENIETSSSSFNWGALGSAVGAVKGQMGNIYKTDRGDEDVKNIIYGNSAQDPIARLMQDISGSKNKAAYDAIHSHTTDYSGIKNNNVLSQAWNPSNQQSLYGGANWGHRIGDNLMAFGQGASYGAQMGGGWGALIGGVIGGASNIASQLIGESKRGGINQSIKTQNRNNVSNIYGTAKNNDKRYLRSAMANPINMNHIAEYGGHLFADGGFMPDYASNGVEQFNVGGSHEENPYGGIPQGVAPDGEMNYVQEGEVKYNDYIYSNMLDATKELLDKYKLPTKYAKKDIATIAKALQKDSEARPNDAISKRTLDVNMQRLEALQEDLKRQKEEEKIEAMFAQMSPEEKMALLQQAMGNQQGESYEQQPQGNPYDMYAQQGYGDGMEEYQQEMPQEALPYANGGKIHIAPEKKGTFKTAATKNGMSVPEFAKHVLANPDNYSTTMIKKANFARNAAKWYDLGGNLFPYGCSLRDNRDMELEDDALYRNILANELDTYNDNIDLIKALEYDRPFLMYDRPYVYANGVHLFDGGGELYKKILNYLDIHTREDFDKFLEKNNISVEGFNTNSNEDKVWRLLLSDDNFKKALSEKNPYVVHAMGLDKGYDFGNYQFDVTKSRVTKPTYDDAKTAQWKDASSKKVPASWKNSNDPGFLQLKEQFGWDKIKNWSMDEFAWNLAKTPAYQNTSNWVRNSKDNTFAYLKMMAEQGGDQADWAKNFIKKEGNEWKWKTNEEINAKKIEKFYDKNGKLKSIYTPKGDKFGDDAWDITQLNLDNFDVDNWNEETANAIMYPRYDKAPASYWKQVKELSNPRNKLVRNYIRRNDGSIQEIIGDVPKDYGDIIQTLDWQTEDSDFTNNYYREKDDTKPNEPTPKITDEPPTEKPYDRIPLAYAGSALAQGLMGPDYTEARQIREAANYLKPYAAAQQLNYRRYTPYDINMVNNMGVAQLASNLSFNANNANRWNQSANAVALANSYGVGEANKNLAWQQANTTDRLQTDEFNQKAELANLDAEIKGLNMLADIDARKAALMQQAAHAQNEERVGWINGIRSTANAGLQYAIDKDKENRTMAFIDKNSALWHGPEGGIYGYGNNGRVRLNNLNSIMDYAKQMYPEELDEYLKQQNKIG